MAEQMFHSKSRWVVSCSEEEVMPRPRAFFNFDRAEALARAIQKERGVTPTIQEQSQENGHWGNVPEL